MSEEKVPIGYPQLPSAPNVDYVHQNLRNIGPPPSYEESQKNRFQTSPGYPQPQGAPAYRPPPQYYASAPMASQPQMFAYSQPGFSVSNQQTSLAQLPQQPYGVVHSSVSSSTTTQYANMQTVQFDAGARFKGKGAGSISVPPPPPGYMPTSAQMAALQGQPVILKKKKNSFF